MGTNHFSSDILKILKNKDKTIVDGDQVLAEIYFEQFHGENGGVYYLTDFKPEHLVGLEVKTGNYVFKNEKGLTLTLTRQKDKSMTVQEMFDRAF